MKTILSIAAGMTIIVAGLVPAQANERHQPPARMERGRGMPEQVRRAPTPSRSMTVQRPTFRPNGWDRPAFRPPPPPLALMLACAAAMAIPPPCEPAPVRYVQPVAVCRPPIVQYVERPTVVVQQVPANEIVWVQNSNGSMTPVTLRRADNGMYVGPRGEFYVGLPSNEQLRQLYGL